jgi:hypothetical protein
MANDTVTIWAGNLRFGRPPADGELLIGDGENFKLATLTNGAGISINNTPGGIEISYSGASGTVISVGVSGGSTGLTFSGSPVTTSGTMTMSGTLIHSNGGTGQTAYTDGQLLIGKTDGSLAKATLTAGTNITITNGDGSITINASESWNFVPKTSDQTITGSTTLTDDSELFVPMLANTTYQFRVGLVMSFTTGGYQYGITGPAAPTRVRWGTSNAYGSIVSAGTTGQVNMFATFLVENGANAGDFKIQFAESAATGSVIMEQGSYIEWRIVS